MVIVAIEPGAAAPTSAVAAREGAGVGVRVQPSTDVWCPDNDCPELVKFLDLFPDMGVITTFVGGTFRMG